MLPAGTRLGEFELQGVLGVGGFGIVYIAHDHSLRRRVALKEYMPSALAMRSDSSEVHVRSERHRETFDIGLRSFVNEARLLAMFDHPSLVKVFRFWEAHGTAYMAMPLYEGMTLKEKLRDLPAPPDEAWLMSLLAPLTEALTVLHTEQCYHRDIAPDNIMLLAGSERPLLLDFGAARQVISDMAQALTVILKPGYAPVEQYAEMPEMTQGPWTDVYALAATMHFAITGKTPPTAVGRVVHDTFVPLATAAAGRYSEGFLRALDRALAVRPADRTASIEAFRADLGLPAADPTSTAFGGAHRTSVSTGTTASAPPGTGGAAGPGSTAKAPQRRKGLAMAGVAAAVLAVGGVAAYWSSREAPNAAPTVAAPTAAPAEVRSPAVAAPPKPAPAAAQPAFEIRDEFAKVLNARTADFTVVAAPTRSTLRIGKDKLGFSITSSRAGFVHVLVLGPDGSLMLMFPNAQGGDNRIKANQRLDLPQASWALDTSEPTGREDFLVIVSEQPRDFSELSQEREYIFLRLPTGRRGADVAAAWTRSTPLLLGAVKGCTSPRCEDYGAAVFSVEVVR